MTAPLLLCALALAAGGAACALLAVYAFFRLLRRELRWLRERPREDALLSAQAEVLVLHAQLREAERRLQECHRDALVAAVARHDAERAAP
jgi:hypothetical protein